MDNNSPLSTAQHHHNSHHQSPPPTDDNLVVRWGHNGSISTAIPTWIPPDDKCPPPSTAGPSKPFRSKGMLHANELLGKYHISTDFDD